MQSVQEKEKFSSNISAASALEIKRSERAYLAEQVAAFQAAGGKVDVVSTEVSKRTDNLTKKSKERMHFVRL